MAWQIITLAVYIALAIFWFLSIHAISYRLIHLDFSLAPCDDWAFESTKRWLSKPRSKLTPQFNAESNSRPHELGWLASVIGVSKPIDASVSVQRKLAKLQRWDSVIELTICMGSLLGLLGTVCGLLGVESVKDAAVYNAFMTTFVGIVVTLPALIYRGLTGARRERIEDQMYVCLDLLQDFEINSPIPQKKRGTSSVNFQKEQTACVMPAQMTANPKQRKAVGEKTAANNENRQQVCCKQEMEIRGAQNKKCTSEKVAAQQLAQASVLSQAPTSDLQQAQDQASKNAQAAKKHYQVEEGLGHDQVSTHGVAKPQKTPDPSSAQDQQPAAGSDY